MSQCGVNVPLDDLVEAIIDNYGDAFAEEIIKRLNLSQYVKVDRGEANDLTLRQSLTVDEAVKSDLCSILQDCIAAKIAEELGCDRDNHTVAFYIDKEKDHLVIDLKFGERYYVSRAELEEWLQFKGSGGGGIKSGKLIISPTDPTQVIQVTNYDDTLVDIDVSDLKNTYVDDGELVNTTLRLIRNDNKVIEVDLSPLVTVVTPYEGYRINTQDEDYELQTDDFDGRTIVRANKDGDQVITIPAAPAETDVGKAIVIRKTNGAVGTFVTLVAGAGVTISPDDATPVRRVGSSVTVVYVGGGHYDVYGELP